MIELNRIYNEDNLATLARMEDNSIDLVVTSPPYNKGFYSPKTTAKNVWTGRDIDYESYGDDMKPEDYEAWQRKIISECIRVLKPTGSLFYNHKDVIYKGLIVPPKWVYDFKVKQQIIWDRQSSCMIDPHYFMPANEWIYWIVKEEKQTFFQKDNAIFRTNIWRMNVEKNPHPAPFPMSIPNNCIVTCCPENGIVYDPFMGSGTTALSVLKVGGGRKYIGSEISKEYVAMAEKRLKVENMQMSLF